MRTETSAEKEKKEMYNSLRNQSRETRGYGGNGAMQGHISQEVTMV